MTCEQCRDKFSELHDGAIVGEQADALRAHIATCRQCEGEYAAFTQTIAEVRSLTPTTPPADLLEKIGAALDAAEPHPTPVRRTWGWTPALAAAACKTDELFEYTPMQVKQAVTGYGGAEKGQVQQMVKLLLHLDIVPRPDDAADALAVAIAHAHSRAMRHLYKIQ